CRGMEWMGLNHLGRLHKCMGWQCRACWMSNYWTAGMIFGGDMVICSVPAEWPRWNVSLRLAVAPAWPAEPVGAAQPATRPNAGTNTLVLVACIRLRRGA